MPRRAAAPARPPRVTPITVALLLTLVAFPALAAVLDTPGLNLVYSTRSSIVVDLTAGASGAPAGFSVEWMKRSDYDALGGWPGDSYHPKVVGCDFDGVYTLNGQGDFLLEPGETVRLELGDMYDETGLYAEEYAEYSEATQYVFRVKAMGSPAGEESGYSQTLVAATVIRASSNDCTLTQGFWKNHANSWNNVSLSLGGHVYSQAELLSILNTPADGNGAISLAHQLIAAKLNVLLGATPTASVAAAISAADAMLTGILVPPVGSGYLDPATTSATTQILDNFNNGKTGPGHCPDTGGITTVRNSSWGRIKSIYR